jgi:RND family efflux transporter MFP subunit
MASGVQIRRRSGGAVRIPCVAFHAIAPAWPRGSVEINRRSPDAPVAGVTVHEGQTIIDVPHRHLLTQKRRAVMTRRVANQIAETLGVGRLLSAIFAFLISGGCQKHTAVSPTPPDVDVTSVIQKDVPIYGEWVGTLDGYVNAQIQPHVTGYLIKQDYQEGSSVKRGQVLFEIDPRPFQALVDQAKGQVAQAKAQRGKSHLDVERDTPLAKARAIAQSQLDNDIQADLANEATVVSAEAQLEQAQLNLGFTRVRSLVDGIAGIAQMQVGDLVTQTAVLTSVSQLDPIKAYFPISEQQYMLIAGRVNAHNQQTLPADAPPFSLILADGTVFPQKGWLLFTDRQVDLATGTIRVVCAFSNPDHFLRPGQFGRVRARTSTSKNALLVPQAAVAELQGSYQVAVVASDNKVNIRTVKVGERVGTLWIVTEGLKSGERVVAAGMQRVRQGTVVNPRQSEQPIDQPANN